MVRWGNFAGSPLRGCTSSTANPQGISGGLRCSASALRTQAPLPSRCDRHALTTARHLSLKKGNSEKEWLFLHSAGETWRKHRHKESKHVVSSNHPQHVLQTSLCYPLPQTLRDLAATCRCQAKHAHLLPHFLPRFHIVRICNLEHKLVWRWVLAVN